MKERYEGIDGLKAYAIIGIALMHILANGKFGLNGFMFQKLIPSFTNLVFLFMMVSGFGMCCGYYQKFKDQKIGVGEFYNKRYSKIWPYFALLCVLDFVMSPSKSALYEVFANLTLCQGLLPNMNISVIGVSWTLAVIFVFYLLFPFFCFLLENKKRAWLAFICAVIYNFVCSSYFFDESHIADRVAVNFSARTNILYCEVYFIAGGLIFLYRKELAELLYISSSEVYGKKTTEKPFVEGIYGEVDIDSIRSSYVIAKRAAEMMCKAYSSEYDVDTVIVRPGHIYGPSAKRNDRRISSDFAFKAAYGEKLEMKSSGLQKRSYCYSVDCAIQILTALMKGEKGQAYNVGHDDVVTIKEMAEIYADAGSVALTATEPTKDEVRAFNPMRNSALDNSKLKKLGYKDTFSVNEGLRHTVEILKEIAWDHD